MTTMWSSRVGRSKRRMCSGGGRGVIARRLARRSAGRARRRHRVHPCGLRVLPRPPEPQQAVETEESEAAGDQHPVEAVRPPERRAALVVARVRDADRTARSARWRPGDTCRTSSAGSSATPSTPGSTPAECRARRDSRRTRRRAPKPSCVTLPWNVRRERLGDRRVARCRTRRSTPRRDASVSVRWIACAVWQSAQTGARASPFFSAAAWTPVSYLRLMPVVARAAGRRHLRVRQTRLVGSVLRPDVVACRGSRRRWARRSRPGLLPRPRVNAVVIRRADCRRDSWRS